MSDVFDKTSLSNDLRRLKNELNMTPDDENLKAQIRDIENKLNGSQVFDEPDDFIIEDDTSSVVKKEENPFTHDKKEEIEDKKEEVKTLQKPKNIKKSKKERKVKKRDNGASVRGIPQPLMNKVRSRVPYATNNKDAIVCFLAYAFEDYENLSDDQIEIAKNIEKEDAFSNLSMRLNAIRDRQIEMEESLSIAMIATSFLTLRNMGLETNSYRNLNDIEKKLLSSNLEDFIEVVKEINKSYRMRNERSESADIHINRR